MDVELRAEMEVEKKEERGKKKTFFFAPLF